MIKTPNAQTSQLNFTTVTVQLNVSGQLSMELVDTVNKACDKAEDLGCKAVLTIHLIGCDEQQHYDAKCSDVDVYLISKWEKSLRRIEKIDGIVICISEAHFGGLGLAVMLTADYRVTAPNISIAITDASGHIMPGMLLHRLVHQLGSAKLRNLVLFGRELSAQQAKDIDLIDAIDKDCMGCIEQLLASLESNKVVDLAIRRRLLIEASSVSYENALGTYLAACDKLIRQRG